MEVDRGDDYLDIMLQHFDFSKKLQTWIKKDDFWRWMEVSRRLDEDLEHRRLEWIKADSASIFYPTL